MNTTPTPEQIEKLPVWAKTYIKDLDRRVGIAERALKEYLDTDTPTPFFVEETLCIGEGSPVFCKRYVQTHRISVETNGIKVDVALRMDDPGVDITWGYSDHTSGQVPMIPLSLNHVRIVGKNDVR